MNYISLSNIINGLVKSVKRSNLLKMSKVSSIVLEALVRKGIFQLEEIETSRLDTYPGEVLLSNNFNEHQEKAYEEINIRFETKNVVLLHGITSSGKTELYIRLIKDFISKDKQVLYLLPEIALTTQIISRLKKHFGNDIGVYHSKFSDSEKVEIWNNLNDQTPAQGGRKRFRVILGVRSSVFLPFSNLGLVIIDEEHENSFKQYDPSPRYNARDAAIYLAKLHNAKTLLGSATPSVESYFNAMQNKYGFVELNKRYVHLQLPQIIVTDTREATREHSRNLIFPGYC